MRFENVYIQSVCFNGKYIPVIFEMCVCVYIYTVEVKTLHTPFRICKMLIILPK